MRTISEFRASALALVAFAIPLTACHAPRETCGTPSPAGGPPVLATKDADLCEGVRLRVGEALGRVEGLGAERAEILRERTWSWEDANTLAGFVRVVRNDAGDGIADAISRAIDEAEAHSRKPLPPGTKSEQRCLVRGAALGARLAFDAAAQTLRAMRRARPFVPSPSDD